MSESFVGEIKMFGGTFAPRDWAFCDGQLLPISQHQALFSILGTKYGGDGRSTFGLPDLRGRVPIHSGNSDGPGLSRYQLGQKGGREAVKLKVDQMPAHAHSYETTAHLSIYNDVGDQDKVDATTQSIAISGVGGRVSVPDKNGFSKNAPNATIPNAVEGSAIQSSTNSSGVGNAISNMQPYLAINFIICLDGVFPPRS